ncbi:MAG: hypothetical protein JO089_02025 [Alphaproteobacteria bacterium]|nr:hypothetical protein [Alphaproteobacteria bacterium]
MSKSSRSRQAHRSSESKPAAHPRHVKEPPQLNIPGSPMLPLHSIPFGNLLENDWPVFFALPIQMMRLSMMPWIAWSPFGSLFSEWMNPAPPSDSQKPR